MSRWKITCPIDAVRFERVNVLVVDPVMGPAAMERLIAAWERFPALTPTGTGSYAVKLRLRSGAVSDENSRAAFKNSLRSDSGVGRRFAPGLAQRVDSASNYLRQGGLRADREDPLLPWRHKYFRETLLIGNEVYATGVEELLANINLIEASRGVFDSKLVVPWTIYANVMLPGQELGLHTDTPEFRGAHRNFLPCWLLCAMHWSGLFEPWRVKIATAVTYLLGAGEGGRFIYYPEGPGGPASQYKATPNTAVVLDSDSIFHGVELLPGYDDPIRHIDANSQLTHIGDGKWSLRCGEAGRLEEVARYSRDELRLSLSWKAYCFADAEERARHSNPVGELTTDVILDTLVDELVVRGRLDKSDHGLSEEELGSLIIDEFIRFPYIQTLHDDPFQPQPIIPATHI